MQHTDVIRSIFTCDLVQWLQLQLFEIRNITLNVFNPNFSRVSPGWICRLTIVVDQHKVNKKKLFSISYGPLLITWTIPRSGAEVKSRLPKMEVVGSSRLANLFLVAFTPLQTGILKPYLILRCVSDVAPVSHPCNVCEYGSYLILGELVWEPSWASDLGLLQCTKLPSNRLT